MHLQQRTAFDPAQNPQHRGDGAQGQEIIRGDREAEAADNPDNTTKDR
jgi:hypothetical protein